MTTELAHTFIKKGDIPMEKMLMIIRPRNLQYSRLKTYRRVLVQVVTHDPD